MQAGLLREKISIYRYEDVQSESGEVTKRRTLVCELRARLLKQSSKNIDTTEQLDIPTIKLQTYWTRNVVRDSDTLCYNCDEYKITDIVHDTIQNVTTFTCIKINK